MPLLQGLEQGQAGGRLLEGFVLVLYNFCSQIKKKRNICVRSQPGAGAGAGVCAGAGAGAGAGALAGAAGARAGAGVPLLGILTLFWASCFGL